MLHRIFAHTSSESPKSGSRSRVVTALLLTVTVLFALSFSGIANAKTSTHSTANHFQHSGKIGTQMNHKVPDASKFAHPLTPSAKRAQAKLSTKHPESTVSGYFDSFQFIPTYGASYVDPDGVAVDGYGDVYVGEWLTGNIYIETPLSGGGYTKSLVGNVPNPEGIAVDFYNNLYIGTEPSSSTGPVYMIPYNGNYGQPVVSNFGTPIVISTNVQCSWQVAVDASGDVFVADDCADTVWEETPTGTPGVYTESTIDDGFWCNPMGVAVDGFDNLYVADSQCLEGVWVVQNEGYQTWSNLPYPADLGLSDLQHVAVSSNGTLYVITDDYLLALYPEGSNGYTPQYISDEFDYAEGVAVDNLGNLYIADQDSPDVYQINTNVGGTQLGYLNNWNTNVTVNFVITSSGTLGNSQVTTQGATDWDFYDQSYLSASYDTCSNQAVTAGQTCSIVIGFGPYTPGVRTGGVTIYDASGSEVASSLAFSGTGIAPRSSFFPGFEYTVQNANAYAKPAPNFAESREKAHLKVPKMPTGDLKPKAEYSALTTYPGVEPDGVVIDPWGDYIVADATDNIFTCAIYASFDYGLDWVTLPSDPTLCPSGGLAVDGSGNVFYSAWDSNTGGAAVAVNYNYGWDSVAKQNDYSLPSLAVEYTNTGSGTPYYIDNLALDGFGNLYFAGSDDSNTDAYVFEVPATAIYNPYDNPWYYVNRLPATNNYTYITGIAADNYGDIFFSDYYLGEVFVSVPQSNNTYYTYPIARGLDTPTAVSLTADNDVYIIDSGDDTGISVLYLNQAISEFGLLGPVPTGYQSTPLQLSYVFNDEESYFWNMTQDSYGNFYITDDGAWGGVIATYDVNDPPSLNFDTTDVGLTSIDSPQTVFLANTGNDYLYLQAPSSGYNPSISPSFVLNSYPQLSYYPGSLVPVYNCPLLSSSSSDGYLYADQSCALPVSFVPQIAGTITGTLVVTDDSLYGECCVPAAKGGKAATRKSKGYSSVALKDGHPIANVKPLFSEYTAQTIDLSGIGVDFFSLDFTVSTTGELPIVKAGGSLTVSLTVAPNPPATTLPVPVNLSAVGAPQGSTYTFSPAVVAAGSGTTTVALTIGVPIQFVAKNDAPQAPGKNNNTKLPIAPLALALLLLPMAGKLRKAGKRMSSMVAMLLLAVAGITGTATLIGCGSNPSAIYDIIVTGTSGVLSHSTSFDIVVKGN